MSWDRWQLPAFDAYVYVAMAEQPRFFTVSPWGHRILTPWLASAVPTRYVARAFRIVTFGALLAAGAALYLYLRALGHAIPAAVAGGSIFALTPPVAECVRYLFLAEPLAFFLEVALLLALRAGAGLGPLCLIVVLGTLAKEFFVLLAPVALVAGPRPPAARARAALVMTLAAAVAALALRQWWTPQLAPPLPSATPATFLLALHRFHDSFPEWWTALLLGGLTPLAILGSFRKGAAPIRSVSLYVIALALVPPFLNPVTFFSSDVPRLLLYALAVAVPLAVAAVAPPSGPPWSIPVLRGRRVGIAAGTVAVLAAAAPLLVVDRYRRADLTGPRDGPYILAVTRESLRAARRHQRGEEVVLDPAERRFVWGQSHPTELDRMRWFLREGWGQRAHYGTGEVTMHEAEAAVLLPVLEPRATLADVHVQSPHHAVIDASVNGRPVGSWAVSAGSPPKALAIPGDALFRGDNVLALKSREGTPGARLRRIAYRAAP